MKDKFITFCMSILAAGILSALGYATHQVFVVIPKVEAKVERIDEVAQKVNDIHNYLLYGRKP